MTAVESRTHHDPDYANAVRALTERFAGVHPPEAVAAAVAQARSQLEADAKVTDFLELLVERRARELLQGGPASARARSV